VKREFIIMLVLFIAIMGCEKKNTNPEPEKLIIEIVHGNGQSGVYNSLLHDSLVVKVTDIKGNPVSKAPVSFVLKTGNGKISPDWVFTDALGLGYVYLTIGCNSEYNELTAYLNDSISNRIDSVTFSATALLPNGWGKSCGIEYTGPFETVFREHNGTIYLANYDMIYTTNDGGISWQEYENMPPISYHSDIFDIQFNSKGWMYIATEDDGIFYTEDYATWHQINNGILDHRDPMTFLVEDTCLFISFYFDGLYRSTDNGKFWRKLLVNGGYSERYVFINRHPNGDLYLFDKWDDFWRSSDNGNNWNRVPLDYKYTNYEVEDFIIDKDGTLYIGAGDATISIVSSETYQGNMHSYYEWNASTQHVEDIKIIDDIIYYTVNGNPEPGIYSSQNWDRIDLGFENPIYAYHLKTDGTFLIASSDGVYYYNKQ